MCHCFDDVRTIRAGEGEVVRVGKQEFKYDLAVVIGRFQVPRPHEGHRALLKTASERAARVLVLVGSAPRLTKRNPLPAALVCTQVQATLRELLITEGSIMPLPDMRSDADWVKRADEMIAQCVPWNAKVVLLFGQDARNAGLLGDPRSAIVYKQFGKHTVEVHHFDGPRGTELRAKAPAEAYARRNEDIAIGMAAAFELMNSHVVSAADVLVCCKDQPYPTVLLGRKSNEDKWRLLGGMVEPGEAPIETATREAYEEARAQLTNIKSLGVFVVKDWRFPEPDSGVLSHLYYGWASQGVFTAGDDIAEVKMFVATDLRTRINDVVVEEHHGLVSIALDSMLYTKGETENAPQPAATDR